jgi:hypothetical protein
MQGFLCRSLTPEQAPSVYPLAREAIPGLELRTWTAFAKRVCQKRRGVREGIIVVQRRPRPLPCGLFVYRCEQDLVHGAILVAEHFIAVDVLDPEPVMRALVAELDRLAERLACKTIRTTVFGQSSLLIAGLREAGHRSEGETLWKTVEKGGEAE